MSLSGGEGMIGSKHDSASHTGHIWSSLSKPNGLNRIAIISLDYISREEELEDTKGVIRIRKSNRRRTDNTMSKRNRTKEP
jgi:hypothetical protein